MVPCIDARPLARRDRSLKMRVARRITFSVGIIVALVQLGVFPARWAAAGISFTCATSPAAEAAKQRTARVRLSASGEPAPGSTSEAGGMSLEQELAAIREARKLGKDIPRDPGLEPVSDLDKAKRQVKNLFANASPPDLGLDLSGPKLFWLVLIALIGINFLLSIGWR